MLLVDLYSYISWQIAISTLISAVLCWLRLKPGNTHTPTQLLSTVAAYNFVYNYIDSKSKTQVVAAAVTAAAAFAEIPAKSAHLQATLS